MPELSNVLRQRLASAAEPKVHPDADILTAYVEQILAAPERRRVLEHLSACRECREVILLLNMPQPAAADGEATPVRLRPGRSGWRSIWGLAASLAGLAIVATVIIEMPRGTKEFQNQSSQAAPASSPAPDAPTPVLSESTPREFASRPDASLSRANSAGRLQDSTRGSAFETAKLRPAETTNVPVPSGTYVNSQMFGNEAGYYNNNGIVISNGAVISQTDLPTAPTPRLSQQPSSLLPGGPVLITSSPAPYEIDSSKPLRMSTPDPNNGSRFFGLSTVVTLGKDAKQFLIRRPTSPSITYRFTSSAMGQPGQFNPAKEPGPSEEATSTFSGKDAFAGDLARSGAFTTRALAGNNAYSIDGAAADKKAIGVQLAWKVGDSKLLKLNDSGSWIEGYPAREGIEFSVVTSHGSDVWAGGANAALVHSHDGGASWERITLGASASGTISSIEASAARIVVRSSSGQSWSSADGGRSWSLQD